MRSQTVFATIARQLVAGAVQATNMPGTLLCLRRPGLAGGVQLMQNAQRHVLWSLQLKR